VSGNSAVLDWRRPRVKPEHKPIRVSGNRIRIGGAVHGIAAEIHDPTGAIWTLLGCLDGRRPSTAVISEVCDRHPELTPDDVVDCLVQLADAGHVEDAAAPEPPELTSREKIRYERSRQFYRWVDLTPRSSQWHAQVELRKANVVIVGLGGTGGNAALALAASGVGNLHCVDCDTVELSNLNRQILYTEKDIGRRKSDAAAEHLREINSDIVITAEHAEIRGVDDFLPLVSEHDLLVLCADNPAEIRTWANRACLATGTTWVDSGYHGPRATVAVYKPDRGPCYECVWLAEYDRLRELGIDKPYSTARTGSNAVAAPSAGMSGHLASYAAIAVITGISPVFPGRLYGVNLVVPDGQYVIDAPRRPDCPACGTKARPTRREQERGEVMAGDDRDPQARQGRDQDSDQ
jgi:molybdopterin/thiamine biosynthesis adenylyltransferase